MGTFVSNQTEPRLVHTTMDAVHSMSVISPRYQFIRRALLCTLRNSPAYVHVNQNQKLAWWFVGRFVGRFRTGTLE